MRQFIMLSILLVVGAAHSADAGQWLVRPDGLGDFPTIQAAIDGAADGDTIQLATGDYSGAGNRDLLINSRDLTLIGQSATEPYAAIRCEDGANEHRAFALFGSDIELRNIAMYDGKADLGGLVYVAGGSPRLIDCRLDNGEAHGYGGLIYARAATSPVFIGCVLNSGLAMLNGGIAYLRGDASLFQDCTLMASSASGNGGAIYALDSLASFIDCQFNSNTAGDRGGMGWITGGPGPIFEDCNFFSCSAQLGGGFAIEDASAPEFRGCKFSYCHGYTRGGGLFVADGSTPVIDHCTFTVGDSPEGAGIFCDTGGAPIVDNTIIAWNREGGAFDQSGSLGIAFRCCDIWHNVGGDWVNGIESQLGIRDNFSEDPEFCKVIGTTGRSLAITSPCHEDNNPQCGWVGADEQGCGWPMYVVRSNGNGVVATIQEAIDLAPEGSAIGLDGVFTGPGNRDLHLDGRDITLQFNYVPMAEHPVIDCEGSVSDPHRGIVVENGEHLTLKDLTIRNAYVLDGLSEGGGAVKIVDGQLAARDCVFEDNAAPCGGGVRAMLGNGETVTLENCDFTGNVANEGGDASAVYVQGGVISIADCAFSGNTADGGGTVFVNTCDSLYAGRSQFSNNAVAEYHGSGEGGGLFLMDAASRIDTCAFIGNDAGRGGGLYTWSFNYGDYPVNLTGCRFESNAAAEEGGALYATGSHDVRIVDCIFVGNGAEQGGAIHQRSGADIEGYSATFEQNGAELAGGAINKEASAGYLYLEDSEFDSNAVADSAGRGGALQLSSDAGMTTCEIECNTVPQVATALGGGIHVENGATLGLETCRILGNSGGRGGAVYVDASTLILDSCRLENCSALSGGALYFAQESGALAYCAFLNNAASSLAGALYLINGSSPTVEGCSFIGNARATVQVGVGCAPTFERCIFAYSPAGGVFAHDPSADPPALVCTDIWGNDYGDWVGFIADQAGLNGNFSAEPLFCDLDDGDLSLYDISPCAWQNSPCGQQVGAYGQGCVYEPTAASEPTPRALTLGPVSPNPFNPTTTVSYTLPSASVVDLTIHDGAGRRVRTLLAGCRREAGAHGVEWDGRDDAGRRLSSGVYLVRLRTEMGELTGKAVLLK